ncbi:MAG: alpha/beta hydrolase-fold protein, partial [Eubacteriales bacterium]|nr:alpha/beta hydrolase-fold protein [Eubacteriales bacterium]
LALGSDGTFTISDGDELNVAGTFTYEKKNGWGGPSTNVTLDDESMGALSEVMPWYSYIKLGDGTFTITRDVSKALADNGDINAVTVANSASSTGYTTTFTVADNGYENLYAYGDWVAAYKTLTDETDPSSYSEERFAPEQWANGMDYCTSSILPMTKDETTGNWTLTLNLASSVMGIACYHDVEEADLTGLFPQKKSFYIPYDAEKQSESTDWTPAFPASENGNEAGTVTPVTTANGVALNVYTPAGYSEDKQYPVMYLIAGGGSTEASWFTQGMAGNIFDNLTAEGKVEPTVLVAMGFQSVSGTQLQDDVIPYIEANYSVYTDAAHRALGGVSMGSATATNIWLANPELFSYYAFLSGANKSVFTSASEGEQPGEETVAKMAEASYFIGGGTTDFNMFTGDANSASISQLDAWMDSYGIAHNTKGDGNYEVVLGDHNWPIWMQLMIPYASDYLWQSEGNEGGEAGEGLELRVTSDILGLADTG